MKKIIIAIVAFILFSSQSEGRIIDGYVHSVGLTNGLIQYETGYNYSCGPTSLAFIENFWYYKSGGHYPTKVSDPQLAKEVIEKLYSDGYNGVSIPLNRSSGVSTDELKQMVIDNKSGWVAVKANGNNSLSHNLSLARQWIDNGYPLIVGLKASYPSNPVGNFGHIVVIYGYDYGNLYYHDPYYGEYGKIRIDNLSSAIQGNLPYLRVAPH
ncbi:MULTISPECIES: C39 family peptidase [unclassified Pseudoalteromonas]|uniref:C39 family peptidase n=1 Tax=unclassified Pseudoalteromonas TaxID=194690 RepID=UPI001F24AD91|nr:MULTISPECIES: C39 family peptidase [unclassified Pseudoalteromonas]MCF2827120.1 C39 family peptidase [Pseudoalteromonas sp. OF5H-5]MCF2834530.1 C39 family peptidase [Pseudoalteromonas sp. DL2-H6]MCF2925867.1 C39 family peptidase [Pseudoalteromonas sp. DL2-H1]